VLRSVYQIWVFNRQTPFIDFRFRIYRREALSRFSCAASLVLGAPLMGAGRGWRGGNRDDTRS
ncbi:hypothetical protein ABLN86_15995, partial [Mycobacterium tuberculosis]